MWKWGLGIVLINIHGDKAKQCVLKSLVGLSSLTQAIDQKTKMFLPNILML